MKTRKANRLTCIVALLAVVLYVIAIIMAGVRGSIAEAYPLAVIFLLIEDAPLTEMLLPAVHLGLFIGAAILFVTNLSAFKSADSGKAE